MHKIFKYSLLLSIVLLTSNCSKDDNDCPDTIYIDLNDPESLRRAEECGLSPAKPLSTLWISDSYRLNHKID